MTSEELRSRIVESLGGRQPPLRIAGVRRGAAAYLLWRTADGLDRPILVVTASAGAAEELAAGLATMFGEKPGTHFLGRRVHVLPPREAPPLEMVSAPSDVEAGRLAALYQLAEMRAPIVVASVDALMWCTPTPNALRTQSLYLVVGDELDRDAFAHRLTELGYRRVGLVEEPGEMAVRGGIVDVWPPGAVYPCRIELDGDRIESLRLFDPSDQRSFEKCEEAVVLPAGAFPPERLRDPAVRRAVHARCNELMLAAGERRQLDALLAGGEPFPGYELLRCYVEPERAWIGDYLGEDCLLVAVEPAAVTRSIEESYELLAEAREAAVEAGTFFPEIEALYVSASELRGLFERRPRVELDSGVIDERADDEPETIRVVIGGNDGIVAARARVRATRSEGRFRPMIEALEELRGSSRTVVLASDPTQLERLAHLLELGETPGVARATSVGEALAGDASRLWLVYGHLEEGFRYAADGVAMVTDEEIFGQRRARSRRRRNSRARALTALTELQSGDFVVHVDHGIGLYHGLKHLKVADSEGDFLHLEYAGGDRLYVPVDRINLVEKYTGTGSTAPPLARLGAQAWQRTKKKAKESILRLASELLEIEAYRASHIRPVFARADGDYEEFEAHFPFEETEDQSRAIREVVADLTAERPMDRVVCGDVGYGKTEVALRATYLAAMAGKQVAVLVPTTVLARQHFDTFRQRFDGYPLRIEMLSRFHGAAENKRIVRDLAAGTVDVVIGTHRLLQRDVSFARLGLVVVDEEHRFGVKAKERLKRLRREVDVLTLTATPIPRTLQLALTGVRDLSLIETPPVDRLAIRTYVARYDEGLIKQAIERELARGGQAFFVHNRVASIAEVADRVRSLVPRARVAVAHGRMQEAELEQVMLAFLAHDYDVLVCTSIIESGLDIPNANTILVNRADTFGLAQLYQIRGRVGRSHRRAYAYLLVPGERVITEQARQRLAVLQQLDDLGSGFRLAAHDMEIRGAGNLLGKEQSGHVAAVGFDLFMQMVEEATAELRGQPAGPRIEPEIELGADAFIPEGYIDDVAERLLVYKRMANAADRSALAEIADELVDRFGPMPRPVENFVRMMGLRPALKTLLVESVRAANELVSFRFHPQSPVDGAELVRLATADPERYRLRPSGVFTMKVPNAGWEAMLDAIEKFLDGSVERLGVPQPPGEDLHVSTA